jgi:hypothetical protein
MVASLIIPKDMAWLSIKHFHKAKLSPFRLAATSIQTLLASTSVPASVSSGVLATIARAKQQQSSQQQQAKQDNTHENQAVNSILPSRGQIITGGSNQEHESKRARRDYNQRVHTMSLRLPLNQPAWSLLPITFKKMISSYATTPIPMPSSQRQM